MNRIVSLSILDGQPRSSASELLARAVNGGHLHLLAEVSAPTEIWDATCREVIAQALRSVEESGSAGEATALQAATDAVNEMLLSRNSTLDRDDQVWASLNAAFIRDTHLYLAQAGPTLTYIARGKAVTRFPKEVSDLQGAPLGELPALRPRLAHFELKANDLVALVSSRLVSLGSEEQIHSLLRRGDADEIATALKKLTGQGDFSALLVQVAGAAATSQSTEQLPAVAATAAVASPRPAARKLPAPSVPVVVQRHRPPPPPSDHPVPLPPPNLPAATPMREVAPAEPPADRPRPSNDKVKTEDRVKPPPVTRVEPALAPVPRRATPTPATQPPLPERSAALAVQQEEPEDAGASSGERGTRATLLLFLYNLLLSAIGAGERVVGWVANRRQQPGPATADSPTLPTRIGHLFLRASRALGRAVGSLLHHLLPGERDRPSGATSQPSAEQSQATGRGCLLVLPVLLLLLVAGVAWMQRGGELSMPSLGGSAPATEDPATLVADARGLLEQAVVVEDGATAQRLAAEANALLDQAIAQEPALAANPEVVALRAQAQQVLSAGGTVVNPPLARLATFTDASQPTELVFADGTPFVLDMGTQAVYRVLLGNPEPVLLEPGTTLPLLIAQQSLGDGAVVGQPVHLVMVPKGGTRPNDALMIMTADGQLFDYDVQSQIIRLIARVALPDGSDIRALRGYDGNLYALDSITRQVWKYVPDANGQYGQEAQPWLTAPGQERIPNPIDFAIDGFIYILNSDGTAIRLLGGEPRDFALQPPGPLSEASAIAKLPPEQSDLFIADGVRVLRFAEDGSFLKEYRAPAGQEWGLIRDLAFDPATESLFVLSDSGLYTLDLRGLR